MKNKFGFTLVELLIVITLIGILSAIFINTSQTNIKRANDGKRQTDLALIQAGIETYRADCNSYPLSDQISFTVPPSSLTGDDTSTSCRSANTYITSIPQDVMNEGGTGPSYIYRSSGTTYEICAALETGTGTIPAGTCAAGCGSATCNYRVINP